MIRIGIIDDIKQERQQLRQYLVRFELENSIRFEVHEFDSAAAYLKSDDSCDILYLDIYMPAMSGMELAAKIRETNQDLIIIFSTNLQQFALNGYSVSALGFMVKPVGWQSFSMYLERALKIIRMRGELKKNGSDVGQKIAVKDGSTAKFLYVTDIEYVEVRQHTIFYNVKDGMTGKKTVIKNRGSMREVSTLLSPYGFARCSASFLVNLNSITAVSQMNVKIGKVALPIGRSYKKSFTEVFSKYLEKCGWTSI